MKRRSPLSPNQSAAFAMGRALLVFDVWSRGGESPAPIDVERAMLIDFAAQHPRSVRTTVPELERVIRAHALQKNDLADAFARGHFGIARERFLSVVTDLIARGLLVTQPLGDRTALTITETGRTRASIFRSPLSFGLRAVLEVLCDAWRRRNPSELLLEVRRAIPDESQFAATLREPFARWIVEAE
jgi:hypothetical protein